uniref:ABC-type xenobiotic transporter n=1 Tax=Culicoides sonorensis TaxID=179676 RepID=A0A336LPK6_CULSO
MAMWRWNWSSVCENGLQPFSSLNSTTDLAPCFQQICIQTPVYSVLAIFSSYYFGLTFRVIDRNVVQRRCIVIRMLVTIGLALIPFIKLLDMIHANFHIWPGDILVSVTEFIAWIMHFGYLTTILKSGVLSHRGPLILNVCWSIASMMSIIWLRTKWDEDLETFAGTRVCLHAVYLITLLPRGQAHLLRRVRTINDERQALLNTNYISFDEGFDEFGLGAAQDDANLFSRLTFSWVKPLISKAGCGLLTCVDDLFDLPDCLTVSKIRSGLQSHLDCARSLFTALHKSFGLEFYLIGILRLASDMLGFAGPLLLGGLLSQSESDNKNAYYYALGLLCSTTLSALFGTHFNWRISLMGMKMRIGLVSAIYRKTLEGDGIQSSQTDIVVLMSTDTDRIVNSCISFHSFWSIPFQLVATLYLLYTQLGTAFIAGVIFAATLIPINRWIAGKIASLSDGLMTAKDKRVTLTSEAMAGAKQVKLNAWEDVFIDKINTLRKEEMKFLAKRKYLDALCVYFWATTPVIMCVLTFGVSVLMGRPLTAATTYTSVALLNMLIGPLNAFPWVLNGLAEAWVSLKRVQRLLDLEDVDVNKLYTVIKRRGLDILENLDERPIVLEIQDGHFQYEQRKIIESDNERENEPGYTFQLIDVNIKVRRGDVICVKGSVGSGKTSLLLAIMGHLKHNSGRILTDDIEGGFGYVSQSAWLQRGTIRDNIIWGSLYDESRYKAIISCCALQEDLEALGGDKTGVGEGGRTLSGGQRARVALARALYQDKSIYLLDDILSALDAHVASHIVKHCIFGFLTNKTRIIVTENKTVLFFATQVLQLDDGRVSEVDRNVLGRSFEEDSQELDDVQYESELASVSSALLDDNDDDTLSIDSLIMQETKEVGTLNPKVFKFYWDAMTGPVAVFVLFFIVFMQASRNLTDTWLAHWVTVTTVNSTSTNISVISPKSDRNFYLGVYIGLSISNSVITFIRAFIFAYGGVRAAKFIHNLLLNKVFYTKFQFFDCTPLGRILNRFSSDLYTIDDSLPFILNILLAQLAGLIGALAVSIYAMPWLTVFAVPLIPIYLSLQNRYRFASRDIKRLASNALSPLYAHFTETLQGLVTIRSMRANVRFARDFSTKLEESIRAQLTASAASQWLGLRLQLLGALFVGFSGLIAAATSAHTSTPGLVGLAISYALSISGLLAGVLNAFAETEQEFVAVERVSQYCDLEEEVNADGSMDPPYGWPCQGVLSFENVVMSYRPNLQPALQGINLNTEICERIGVVGRTGSGKSSLIAATLRVAPLTRGIITLDCVNLAALPLSVLRSRISCVPQDPFLFSGTIRENLDPRNEHVESEIMSALSHCLSSPFVQALGGLDAQLKNNLSAGQKQLLCLTRALLKNSKVVLVDEGTANLDPQTESIIQTVLQTAFRTSTVILIAHRLNGLENMNRIVVMNNGKINEIGSPLSLGNNPNSMFHQLLFEQGNTNYDSLALVKI